MKHPRDYRGTEKGQKGVYSHMVVDARSNRNGAFDHSIDLFIHTKRVKIAIW